MTKPLTRPTWDTNDTNTAPPGTTREDDGWEFVGPTPEKPPVEIDNYLKRLQYLWIEYLNEQGITEWDTNITYQIGAVVVATTDKLIYRCLVSQSGNDPVGDTTNWHPIGQLVNNLTSTDETRALTAAQGKILKDVQDTLVAGSVSPATETSQGIIYVPKQIIGSNNGVGSIDTTAGNFRFADGTGTANISSFTKSIASTWVSGSTNGGLADALTLVANNTYHVFALSNADGSIVDIGFDESITAANLIADTNVIAALGASAKYSRLLSIRTEALSTDIKDFKQTGNYFQWIDRVRDADATYVFSTTAQLLDLTIPNDIDISANISLGFGTTTSHSLLLTSPYETDIAPVGSPPISVIETVGSSGDLVRYIQTFIITNVIGQIRTRATFNGAAGGEFFLFTLGYTDLELDI